MMMVKRRRKATIGAILSLFPLIKHSSRSSELVDAIRSWVAL
jgi:hypothetical protein